MKRLLFLGALLLPSLALAEATPVVIVGQPVQVTGTFTSAGQGNTFGATATLNANNVCATVWLAGQRGASFDLVPGTLGATLTPSFSADATQVSNGCNAASGNWTTSKFLDPVTGVETATLVVSNPNAGTLLNVKIGSASCAKVCTGSSGTTGTTTAFLVATQATATPAPVADTSDRAGRLLGVTYGSQGQQLQQTAANFNLRSELAVGATLIDPRAIRALTSSDVVTANAGTGTFAVSAASLPLPTGAATSALQTALNSLLPAALDGSGFLKTHEQGTATITGTITANAGSGTMAVSAAALPLPTGAAADTSVNGLLLIQGSTTSGQKGTLHQGAVTTAAPTYTTAQTAPISLQTDGSQRMAVTNTPTVTANAGSGTFAVSAAALPLPTGAAQDTSVTGLQVTQGSTTSGQKGSLQLGAVATSAPTLTNGQSSALSLTTAGAVRTDASATTQPVSGTVTANVGTTNGLALDATMTGGTLKAKVTGNAGAAMDAAGQNAASPANSLLVAGQFNTSPTTITSGNVSPLQLDSAGNVKVNVAVGGGTGGTSSTFNAASPSVGTAAGGLVTTSAPTYTTGQMGGLSLDTAGNLRVAGSFSAGAAADTAGSLVSLTTACATGVSCGANTTALVAMAGQSSVNVTFSSGSSPVMTVVADCSKDGGTTYLMGGSPTSAGLVYFATDAGVFSSAITNPGNTSYTLLSPDACTHVRVRVGALTSGTVSAQVRSVTGVPDGSGFTGIPGLALGYPPLSVGLMAQDSSTATTGRALVASANGLIVASPTAGNFLVTTTPPANASSNVAQVNGTTTDTNSGTKSAGTLRVVLATDQPALTNKLLVTPDSVALPANQSVNESQINGVTPLMGNGTTGTGSQRVTIASDNTAFTVNAAESGTWNVTNISGTVSLPSGASTETTVAKLTQTQGSTTSGQSGPLLQAAVTTAAPTYTNGQTSPITMDTSGNVRMVWSGTGNLQGLGTAGSPSGGVLTVQPPSSGSPSMPVTAPNGFNAADQNAATTQLSTACSLTTACLNTASIQWPMNGASASEVTITGSSSPLGFTSQVVDASYDATGTTYTLAKCVMVRSDATSTGTVKVALVNADLTSTPSSWEIMCPGAPSWVRFRVAGTPTSGSFNVAGHAVSAAGQARTQGAAIALGAPLNAAGSNIGQAMMAVDSATATTGRMVRADANGLLVSQATAANLNATVIGGVSNDTSAIAAGAETLPAVARASGTATTAGRAEKLQISSGAGGLFVEGPVANGATAAGNPLGMAGIGRATSAAPTQVTAGQSSALTTDLEHRLWVAAEHPNGSSCIVDAASASTQCVGLSGSGLSYYIKSVTFSASAAITFKVNSSTTAGNACATSPALVIPTMYFGANTGAPITFPQPIKVTANSALCCLPSGASGSCIISGYIAP